MDYGIIFTHIHPLPVMKKKHRYYNPGLQKCVENLPPLIGCEAAYLFPTDIEICPTEGRTGGEERGREDEKVAGNLVIHVRSGDIFAGTKAKGYGQVRMRSFLVNTHVTRVCRWPDSAALR